MNDIPKWQLVMLDWLPRSLVVLLLSIGTALFTASAVITVMMGIIAVAIALLALFNAAMDAIHANDITRILLGILVLLFLGMQCLFTWLEFEWRNKKMPKREKKREE